MSNDSPAGAERTAVITGATKGLGRALSLVFAGRGYEVIGLYRSDEGAARAIESEFSEHGFRGFFIRQDITAEGPWPEFEDAIAASVGKQFTLIANASASFTPGPFHRIRSAEFLELFDVNVRGTFNVFTRLLLPMVKAKCGTVISVLSSTVEDRPKGFGAYIVSKNALRALTEAAATEYRDRGIRFLCVSPGFMDTELTRSWSEYLRDWFTPLNAERPSDIAYKILQLAENRDIEARGENYYLDTSTHITAGESPTASHSGI